MKKSLSGFTLIETIVFLTVLSLMISTLYLTYSTGLKNQPAIHTAQLSTQLADQCMEGFLQIRRSNGFNATGLACASNAVLPSVCSSNASASITCTKTLSGDTSPSKLVTVSIAGNATLTLLLANT